MKYIYLALLILFSSSTFSQVPATEIRAVWLTTNWMLDWPRNAKSEHEQKEELESILDELQRDNFNVVLFQARAQGKVFYKSYIEEASPYFDSRNGFDPLAFAIEACHARGMECHAWITTFPVEKIKLTKSGKVAETRPAFYKQVNANWYLDPGRPETRERILLIAKEIVNRYDVDGLHLDYIRYPDNPKTFDDKDTYRLYGKGQNKEQWRRENVNKIVFDLYDTVKSIKNWVQVSSSPIGKYRALRAKDGWTAFESVHQDAGHWMMEGKHDLLFPMMYTRGNQFFPYVDKWLETSNNRPIVPGLATYQLNEAGSDWKTSEIVTQMEFAREKETSGQAYFRTAQIIDNTKGIRNSIQKFYLYPAKLPALTWLSDTTPHQPLNFEVFKDSDGELVLQWDPPTMDEKYTYNVYFSEDEHFNLDNPQTFLTTNLHRNFYTFPASVGEYGFYYFVTASDRYHNESEPSESAYFVHSENVY